MSVLAVTALFCATLNAQAPSAPTYSAALAEVQKGRFSAAIPMLEKILIQAPGDLKARNLLGIALMSSGRRREANVQFRKTLAADPRFHPALKNLAINELELGERKEARAHFEQAARLVPRDAVVHFHLGRIHFAESRFAQAAAQFEMAQDGFPDPYQAGFNLVLAYVRSGNYAAAIRAGEPLAAAGHRTAELYNLLAQAHAQSGEIQQAYDALRTATRIDPREESNYLDLMRLSLENRNWDLSLEISEIALERIPRAHRIRLQRGAVFAMQGRLEEAASEFDAAARAAPGENLPHVAAALVRIEQSRLAEAIDSLRARRSVSPNDYLVNWILGEALVQALVEQAAPPGTPAEKEAAQALNAAVRANPRAAPPRALLAKLAARRGDPAAAIGHFEVALRLDPEDASSAYQLAVLCQKTGKTQRAAELFAKVGQARAEDPARTAERNLVRIIREGSR